MPFDFLSGAITRDEYITRYRPEYPVIKYINKHLPQDAKILFIFMGNRGYFCDREYVFDMKNYRSTLLQLVKNEHDPKTVSCRLKRMEITHFLIRRDIFDKWMCCLRLHHRKNNRK